MILIHILLIIIFIGTENFKDFRSDASQYGIKINNVSWCIKCQREKCILLMYISNFVGSNKFRFLLDNLE